MANAFRPPSDLRGDGPVRGPLERHIRALQAAIREVTGTGYRPGEPLYFTSSGTFDKANYPGLRAVKVECVGGGGAGGGSNGLEGGGAGGGAGGYALSTIPVASLDTSETITVGSGGVGDPGNGDSGGQSSFSAHVIADGGRGGRTPGNDYWGGAGGGSNTGDFTVTGNAGANGSKNDTGGISGGGVGGGGPWGGSGRGFAVDAGSFHGLDATGYGGGGGGALRHVTGNSNGGDGFQGVVIVTPLY